ncbi:putative transcriptional regulator [Nesterenkonia lacusekhoensis]|uniref:Transcriptional regulator n=1 Tax=Nesterenkonia lacusekhoensis TaxID=150832 RepID=A0ABS4T6U7_9MICC|nr:hypothetical protein [Nesterenkonia lacusekhoensis]MBP2319601.1 putative transcriptional regulator [Nesterenkonia lacusekhoensis]
MAARITPLLEQGRTVSGCAVAMGVDPRTIRKILSGENEVQVRILRRIGDQVDDLVINRGSARTQNVARDRDALLAWFESRGRVRPGQTLTDLIGIGRQAE